MTKSIPPKCLSCIHIIGVRQEGFGLTCKAFPEVIPEEIIEGDFDHRKPYPNAKNPTDNGIRYKKK